MPDAVRSFIAAVKSTSYILGVVFLLFNCLFILDMFCGGCSSLASLSNILNLVQMPQILSKPHSGNQTTCHITGQDSRILASLKTYLTVYCCSAP